jgi:hypothetical protein
MYYLAEVRIFIGVPPNMIDGLCSLAMVMYVPRKWMVIILRVLFSRAMARARRKQYPRTDSLGKVSMHAFITSTLC